MQHLDGRGARRASVFEHSGSGRRSGASPSLADTTVSPGPPIGDVPFTDTTVRSLGLPWI